MVNAAAIARFADSVDSLTGGFGATTQRLGLAVSGGRDSMAMLILGEHAFPGRIAAATVDHRLRLESAVEATQVAEYCAARDVPHAILLPDAPITGSVQVAARAARYALLTRWRETEGLDWLATAHHADDQRETIMMRLARGSGVAGLAGVRAKVGRCIRPLLGWTRAELADVCAAAGVTPCDDASNRDLRFDRVRWRERLATADLPLSAPAVARSAAALADADEALRWMTGRLADERLRTEPHGLILDPAGLPDELLRRLLVAAVQRVDPGCVPRGEQIDRTIAALRSGDQTMLGDVLCHGGLTWRFAAAPLRGG